MVHSNTGHPPDGRLIEFYKGGAMFIGGILLRDPEMIGDGLACGIKPTTDAMNDGYNAWSQLGRGGMSMEDMEGVFYGSDTA